MHFIDFCYYLLLAVEGMKVNKNKKVFQSKLGIAEAKARAVLTRLPDSP